MKPGAVLVDVAVDQGGCIETSRPTTHSDPTYVVDGVIHYGVANMPGAVPSTSTYALTNATMPYIVKLAGQGGAAALGADRGFLAGLNVCDGQITYEPVAQDQGLEYTTPADALAPRRRSGVEDPASLHPRGHGINHLTRPLLLMLPPHADDQPADPQGQARRRPKKLATPGLKSGKGRKKKVAAPQRRGVCTQGLHDDAEEAELGAAQGRPRPPLRRHRR